MSLSGEGCVRLHPQPGRENIPCPSSGEKSIHVDVHPGSTAILNLVDSTRVECVSTRQLLLAGFFMSFRTSSTSVRDNLLPMSPNLGQHPLFISKMRIFSKIGHVISNSIGILSCSFKKKVFSLLPGIC
jgi:hypothetical protein